MYLKLTRLDGKPIWINSAFVVTIEPARNGGAVVVPIGDGLDYDVRESPERVLEMLADAPTPAVVPVPAPKSLTKMPDDVSPDDPEPVHPEPTPPLPVKSDPTPAAVVEPDAPASEPETKSVKTKATRTKKPTAKRTRTTKKAAEPILTDDQVERVRRMAPGSVRKLQNTLVAQFKIADAESAVKELVARGVMTLDQDHVDWNRPTDATTVAPEASEMV